MSVRALAHWVLLRDGRLDKGRLRLGTIVVDEAAGAFTLLPLANAALLVWAVFCVQGGS